MSLTQLLMAQRNWNYIEKLCLSRNFGVDKLGFVYGRETLKKHIIIAGVPRSGKSTISQKISNHLGYQHISMDSIIAGIESVFPETGIHSDAETDFWENIQYISSKMALWQLDTWKPKFNRNYQKFCWKIERIFKPLGCPFKSRPFCMK